MGVDSVREAAVSMMDGLKTVVRGQDEAIRELVIALVAGGHVLLEGPPGLGKTLLVRTLARLVGAEHRRIQFTPDLMPADVIGTSVFRPQTGEFLFVPGPIFTQILLADEINRTPPKTQAALLEAMQERQVTIDGRTHPLPEPFFVVATQNPIEYEGTYPLPEAQLDRFFMKISIGYPQASEDRAILDAHAESLEFMPREGADLRPVMSAGQIVALRRDAAAVFVEDSVRDYIVRLATASRRHRRVWLGASSRAAVALMFAAKAAAACEGRAFVRPDDVKSAAPAVLRHRVMLRPETEIEGLDSDHVIAELLGSVEVPRAPEEHPTS